MKCAETNVYVKTKRPFVTLAGTKYAYIYIYI